MKKNKHSDLSEFRNAKSLAINNFKNLLNINDSLLSLSRTLSDYDTKRNFIEGIEKTVSITSDKCIRINKVIERKQMKCAIFGRTSNGKSSVINAMLGQRILPCGIGHTTNCFVQIQGTAEHDGYMVMCRNNNIENNYKMEGGSDSKILPVKSIYELNHALSNEKASSETLISLHWPYHNCELLKAEVTLLDSPGIDIDPDLDYWINHNCLDADVFVLVANAESTLTQTEKSFFHKVKETLSSPNIFILNNRWDACDFEENYVAEAKKQHEQRCIDFLVKELEVCSHNEALERVFFVSAKEMLEFRTSEFYSKNRNDKILERYENFLKFERSIEKVLCSSALKTKFASHSVQGLEMIENILSILNNMFNEISEHLQEIKDIKAERTQFNNIVRSGLSRVNEVVCKQISNVMDSILHKVSESLRMEIKQLRYTVKKFSSIFDSNPGHLLIYKTELNNFVEHEINKRISSFCSTAVKGEMIQFKKFLIDEFSRLIGYEIDVPFMDNNEKSIPCELIIPCNSLFSNFKEDLSFQWPFSPFALLINVLNLFYETRNQISTSYEERNNQPLTLRFGGTIAPILGQIGETVISKECIGFCFITAFVSRITGFKIITSAVCSYAILYLFERFRWSTSMQEKYFKQQYVNYASSQLTNLTDICTRSYSCMIKNNLYAHQKFMTKFVDNEMGLCDAMINKCEMEIRDLDEFLETIKTLNSRSITIQESFIKFKELYL